MKKKMMLLVMLLTSLTLTACGSNGTDTASKGADQETTEEAAEATTVHQHEWTYMEDDTQTWLECEECGARKDIQDKVTEATT